MTILRAYRLLQGKTLMIISKESGIDIAKLSYAERGIVPLSAAEYKRLSKILNLPTDAKFPITLSEKNEK